MDHVWHWLMDFIGVNYGENSFATHMYNFWSGFGGNISVLALGGTVFGIYRHNLRRLARLNPIHHRSHEQRERVHSGDRDD
ncbi:MAG: hypothetical protein JOZ82_08010 [Marmoricola sp.]|nr:hypothetical protein [Marmoricola sp.]